MQRTGLFYHKSRGEGRKIGEVWTHLPLIILRVRGFSLDLWTSELPHTTNLLINREIPWKNFEQPLCICVCVFKCVKKGRESNREGERAEHSVACANCGRSWQILSLLFYWISRTHQSFFFLSFFLLSVSVCVARLWTPPSLQLDSTSFDCTQDLKKYLQGIYRLHFFLWLTFWYILLIQLYNYYLYIL